MTGWAFTAAAVGSLGEQPQALVLPVPPAHDRAARSALRRQVLSVLVRHALGRTESVLTVDDTGRRRLGERFVSVAWRPGWAAVVVASGPVGIDLELVDEAAGAMAVIGDGVTVVDSAAWHGPAGLWAAREAVLKAAGRDLTSDPGGWIFAGRSAGATGIARHRVDLVARHGFVVAVAYAGA